MFDTSRHETRLSTLERGNQDWSYPQKRGVQTEQFTEPMSGEHLFREQPSWKIREFWEDATRARVNAFLKTHLMEGRQIRRHKGGRQSLLTEGLHIQTPKKERGPFGSFGRPQRARCSVAQVA
jgi:hypothetical protein